MAQTPDDDLPLDTDAEEKVEPVELSSADADQAKLVNAYSAIKEERADTESSLRVCIFSFGSFQDHYKISRCS